MSQRIARQPEPEVMDIVEEAEAYARADFSEVNEAFVARLIELTADCEQALAIDLGCGPADIPIRLARRRPGWRIVAADASLAMLRLAHRAVEEAGLAGSIELLLADAKEIKIPAASFDVVFSNSILHHISDPAPFWRELRRVARPGARVFLRDLARPASSAEARALVRRYAGGESNLLQDEFLRSLLAAYTLDEAQAQLEAAGLAGLQVAMASDRHLDIFGRLA